MPNWHVRKISFVASFFIYDEEVTIRKRNLYWDILQQFRHVYGLVFAFSRSSEMSIWSSLVALMALSFSPPLMNLYVSSQLAFISVGVISYKVALSFASGYEFPLFFEYFHVCLQKHFMSHCGVASFWHTSVFTLFSLYMSNTMCICEVD